MKAVKSSGHLDNTNPSHQIIAQLLGSCESLYCLCTNPAIIGYLFNLLNPASIYCKLAL
jgi:hypothetical protein